MRCPDCHVHPGRRHRPGCANEHCPVCGERAMWCGCEDRDEYPRLPWSGEFPAEIGPTPSGTECRLGRRRHLGAIVVAEGDR
jgi:hypothetical protein